MHDIADLEARGVPGVFVATTEFVDAAEVQSDALGIEPRPVFVPHPIQDRTDAELVAIAEQTIEDLVSALTEP